MRYRFSELPQNIGLYGFPFNIVPIDEETLVDIFQKLNFRGFPLLGAASMYVCADKD